MHGKVVVITGATSGIGELAALRLAGMGARLVLVARSRSRAAVTLAKLKAAGKASHSVHHADLSSIAEMKRVGAAIAAVEPRIDVLVNNAGAIFGRRQTTADGLERTFAVNHLAYVVLTHALLPSIRAAAPSRIVSTASDAHRGARINFDDLQFEKGYTPYAAYKRSKLANILFTRALAKRLAGGGVAVGCLHPGFVATRFGDEAGGWFAFAVRTAKLFARKPMTGAETIVWLASSPETAKASGGYYEECRLGTPDRNAADEAAAERLWRESERIAGIAF